MTTNLLFMALIQACLNFPFDFQNFMMISVRVRYNVERVANRKEVYSLFLLTKYYIVHMCMYLCGVAVLELDSHPDQNKGPGPRTLP